MRTIVLSLVLAASVATTAGAQEKKRIAILDFDNAGVPQTTGVSFFDIGPAQPNVGKSTADLLLAKLVQDGQVTVIERAAIDKVLAEQSFSNSNRVDAQTAAQIGRILGVDAIVLGSVARYTYEDKTTGGGGGALAGFRGPSMSTKHDFKAQVQLSARVVSPNTAEVLSVSLGSGEVIKKGVKVDLRDSSAAMAMMNGNVNNPIMGEAIDKAIVQLAPQLEQSFTKLPPRVVQISGLVADAQESGRLVINVGSTQGVKIGDRLQVWREGKEIRDPATGKLLLRDDTLLGDAVVNSVSEAFSIATFGGSGKVQTGDAVRSAPKKP